MPNIPSNDNSVGFVIGNGLSRLRYDLNTLKDLGLVYGCNALYRDFTPDVLVSVDGTMIKEILESEYKGLLLYVGESTKLFFNSKTHPNNTKGQRDGFCCSYGWGSGSSALRLMCELNPCITTINLIGFDLYGVGGKVNNVYADTRNYVDKNSQETVNTNWIQQMKEVFYMFRAIMFYRVGNVEDKFPDAWKGYKNIQFVENIVHMVEIDFKFG